MNADFLHGLPLAQRVAVSYASKVSRPVTIALLALDARLGAVLRGRRDPIASQLRLAWWRERLGEPVGTWPHGEPVLAALRAWRDPSALAALPDGWEALLADRLDQRVVAQFTDARALAWISLAQQLGVDRSREVEEAARTWATADLAANLSDSAEKAIVLAYANALPKPAGLPRALRPLAVLASLGRSALAHGGAPLVGTRGAALLALRTGLIGR